MADQNDCAELGLACADVCYALRRGMRGKEPDDLSQSVRDAITQLNAWVEPVTHSLDISLTILSIVEPWRRFSRGSPSGVSEAQSPASFMRRMTGK